MDNKANPQLQQLIDDTKEAAAFLELDCDDSVWDIMQTFEQEFLENPVGLRITTRNHNELNVRYQTLTPNLDPFGKAVAHGYLTPTDHPVYNVMPELIRQHPEGGYFTDLGVTHGYEKNWVFYYDPLTMDHICEMNVLPPSVNKHLDFYKEHNLNWVSLLGVDYLARTANIYWMTGYPETPAGARDLVTDIGFDAPSDADNEFNSKPFVIYTTHSWDSDAILRISFAQGGPVEAIPEHWDSLIHDFAAAIPLQSGEERICTFNTCYGKGIPSYYKLEADYRASIPTTAGPAVENAIKTAQAAVN